MPLDPLSSIQAGDPGPIPVTAWNRMLELVRRDQATRAGRSGGGPMVDSVQATTTVLVQNDTGSAASHGYCLAVTDIPTDATTNPPEWLTRPVLTGDVPASTSDPFVVLLEPLSDGAVGRAAIAGLVIAQVDVTDTGHEYATPTAADATKLTSATSGPARILWTETGSTGTQACLLMLGDSSAGASLTVKESDGSPSYASISSLEFDQSTGFVVTQPGAGRAKISQAGLTVKETDSSPTYTGISVLEFNEDRGAIVTQPATGRAEISWQDAYGTPSLAPGAASGPGLISADGNDQYLGDGYKYADAWCGAHITIDTVMKTAGYILAAGSVSGSINGAGAFCTVTAGNTYTGSPSMVGGGDVHAIWGLVSRDYYPGNDTSLFYIDAGDPALVRNIVYGIVLPDRTLKEGASGSLAKCEIHGGIVCGGSATIDINDDTTGTLDIANGGTGLSSAPADGTVLTSDGSIYNATPAHVLVAKWTLTV